MAEEKLLTIRDVSLILGISEKEVIDLAESGALPAYKIGGVYLRFKKEQIDAFKKSFFAGKRDHGKDVQRDSWKKYAFSDRIADFFYFNDFYILSALLILLILAIIFGGS